jgi:hypothetical protein
MSTTHRIHRDESGMVGKIIVIWLIMVAVLGVIALDAASVVFATFRASDVAATAATAGATTFRTRKDVSDACDAARRSIEEGDASVQLPKSFCKVDTASGLVTITVKKQARTIVAGRLSFTEDLTKVVAKETAGPSTL